jgi:hypothetical protein
MKAADYGTHTPCVAAFVSTNSVCQGQQVPILWPIIFSSGHEISFAHTSFKWANLASHNAGVTVAIVGIATASRKTKRLFSISAEEETTVKEVAYINAYLVAGINAVVEKISRPISDQSEMVLGNLPADGGYLFFDSDEKQALILRYPEAIQFIRRFLGSEEFINGKERYCLWLDVDSVQIAEKIPEIYDRISKVKKMRLESTKKQTQLDAQTPYRFAEVRHQTSKYVTVVPRVSSENRPYLPVGLVDGNSIIGNKNFALYDAPLWNMAIIASRLHWVWIGTVCIRMRTDFSYSNTLGWNTFPIPVLTEQNKEDLTNSAEAILLARETHFPATIADMYQKDKMPENLRLAHEKNDELIERIYIGRRFKNDTERLEKLFELYTKMTASATGIKKGKK